jgi:drug/metabolite transporter (DMT)-like permease
MPEKGKALALLITVGFSIVGVIGDYFLKLASEQPRPMRTPWFFIGFAVYASTAFGWVIVMQYLKLGTIGVVYSSSMIVLLTGIGIVFFGESLTAYEVVGVVMAIGAMVLLMRFA